MIRAMIASRAAKLLATCVCPVAGAGVVTMSVPAVKKAVHRATAPREYAAPKARVRPAVASPCPTPLSIGAPPTIAALDIAPPPPAPGLGVPADGGFGPPGVALATPPYDLGPAPIYGGGAGGGGNPGTPIAALPDGNTWAQLIIGFGLIGVGGRAVAARNRVNAQAA